MAEEKKDQAEAVEAKKPGLLDNKVMVLGAVVALQLVLEPELAQGEGVWEALETAIRSLLAA